MELETLQQLGIALGLGLLVGLERQWAKSVEAGIRTFALITLFGALCGLLTEKLESAWIVVAGMLTVASMFWIGNSMHEDGPEDPDPGQSTEVAGLLMFLCGAGVMLGMSVIAVVTTGIIAALLHLKEPMHRFVRHLGESDVRAVVRLTIIGMVILPMMPNETYGPFEVLNPFEIWLMVVLIVGISMAAYVVQRVLGAKVGTILAGILGGLISSTATTVGYARRSASTEIGPVVASIVIIIASTTVFARVLVEVGVVAPSLMSDVAPPIVAMMILMILISAVAFLSSRKEMATPDAGEAPSDLKAAVWFGILYAAILFGVAAIRHYFGDSGLYIMAAFSGLTDMDAITLSTAQLMKTDGLDPTTGWRVILISAMSNLLFKLGTVIVLGNRRLFWRVLLMFGLSLLGGVAILLFWPGG